MEKFFEFSEKKNNSLGPGAYYHPKQSSFIKKSSKRNTSSIEEINQNELYNMALFKVVNRKKDIKLNEQKSLIIDKQNKNQVFNSSNELNKSINLEDNTNNTSKLNQNYKLIPTTLTKNRINSIPAKEHYLGYDFDENGLPIIVDEDPLNSLNYNNKLQNKSSKIRKINALDWSKMSKKEIGIDQDTTTKENTLHDHDEFNDLTRNFTNISTLNNKNKPFSTRNKNEILTSISNNYHEITTNNNITKSYKSSTDILSHRRNKIKGNIYRFQTKDTFNIKKKRSLEEFVYDNLFKGEPGPGYYQSNSSFDKYNKEIYKYSNHNFGSNVERKNNFIYNDNNISLGPGSYFKENYVKKIKPDFYPLNRVENKINIKKYEKELDNENVGPGRYNIKSQFDVEKLYYSGPLEKRFFEIDKKINLGPGEYLQLPEWNKNKEENNNNNIKNKNKKEEKKEEIFNEKGRDSYIVKNDNPGAGYYNPDIINSIKYDIISKENKLSHLNIPFNSGQERFLLRSPTTSDLLGPGRYFPTNKSIGADNNIQKIPKNKGLYRINGLNSDELKYLHQQLKSDRDSKMGPGSYNINNFNEWHKKSFNSIMYS